MLSQNMQAIVILCLIGFIFYILLQRRRSGHESDAVNGASSGVSTMRYVEKYAQFTYNDPTAIQQFEILLRGMRNNSQAELTVGQHHFSIPPDARISLEYERERREEELEIKIRWKTT